MPKRISSLPDLLHQRRRHNRNYCLMLGITCHAALLVIVLGSNYSMAATDDQLYAEFKQVYAAYEQAVESDNRKLALVAAARTVELAEAYFGEDNKNTAVVTYNYGLALGKAEKLPAAETMLRKALKRYEDSFGDNHQDLVPVLFDLARYSDPDATPGQLRRYMNRAIKITRKNHGNDSIEAARTMVRAGLLVGKRGYATAALRYQQWAHDTYSVILEPTDPEMAWSEFNLGRALMPKQKYSAAENHLKTAVNNLDNQQNEGDLPIKLTAMAFLVDIYESTGRSELATEYCLAIGSMTPFTGTQDYFPVFKKAPDYPRPAQQEGLEGQVLVEYTVDSMGFVVDPYIVDSTHGVFEDSALEAVGEFRYAPRFEDGRPVATAGVQHIITYKLMY